MDGSPTAKTTDLPRGRHVPLQHPRRHRQDVGIVVKAVGQIVGGQQRLTLYLDSEQVADGVGVFQSVEAMDGRSPWIGVGGRRRVERGFQPRREHVVGRLVGPRATGGRHRLRVQLLQDLLPHFRVFGHVIDVDGVERKVTGRSALVMAGDAMTIEYSPVRGRVRGALGGRRRGCGSQHHCEQGCDHQRIAP